MVINLIQWNGRIKIQLWKFITIWNLLQNLQIISLNVQRINIYLLVLIICWSEISILLLSWINQNGRNILGDWKFHKLRINYPEKYMWPIKMFRNSYPVQICDSPMPMKFKNMNLIVKCKSSVRYSKFWKLISRTLYSRKMQIKC